MANETLYSTSDIIILLPHKTTPRSSQVLDPLIIHNEEDELFDGFWAQSAKKRRLSVDQVQFLEKNFSLENKLEPERKIQLAKELGLQPRQVAIWFQNRRARFKTKQLEKDYTSLKTSYENLKSDYENLLVQNEKLKTDVENLKGKLAIREKAMADDSSQNLNSSMADPSHGIEPEQSDEEENISGNLLPVCFPKLESYCPDDEATEIGCNLIGFQIEDQALGFWPY